MRQSQVIEDALTVAFDRKMFGDRRRVGRQFAMHRVI
jgi:hypothetical protein